MAWWNRKPKNEDPTVAVAVAEAERAAAVAEARADTLADVLRMMSPDGAEPISPFSAAPSRPIYTWNNPLDFYTPTDPSRPPRRVVSTTTLRVLADTYDVLRACIEHLKREVQSVPVEIVPRDPKDNSPRTAARLREARDQFSRSGAVGGLGTRRTDFEQSLFEDLLVVGAAAVYHHPNRAGGIYESVAIDAATIRPAVDPFGWAADLPYEQWIQGLCVGRFTRDQITYDGLYHVSYSPYAKSLVEYLIRVVDAALHADTWNVSWLKDGNTPSDLLAMPDNWTPDQIKQYAAFWDAMVGGSQGMASRNKTKFVPGGTERVGNHSRKDQDFGEFEAWLMRRTCSVFGVSPTAIGHEGSTYKVSQEGAQESTSAYGAGVLLLWRKDLYDDQLDRMGYGEFEAQNVTRREEKASERAERNARLIGSGQRTINETRQEDGLEPVEGGDVILVSNTLVALEQAIAPPPAPIMPAPSDPANPEQDPKQRPATDDSSGDPQ